MRKLYTVLILSFTVFCTDKSAIKEDVVYSEESGLKGFNLLSSPKNEDFRSFLSELEKNSSSFTSDFSMKIQTGADISNLNGVIFFDKTKEKLKIQLQDPFFGMIVSQILSDASTIKIKSAGKSDIHSQPMGDIRISDPSNGKKVVTVPFKVIFHMIALNFQKEIQEKKAFVKKETRTLKLVQDSEEFIYEFHDKGLKSIEYIGSGTQAKSSVPEKFQSAKHPPLVMITRVTDKSTGRESGLVEIKMKNLSQKNSIPASVFQF